jgi:hypothetical protein
MFGFVPVDVMLAVAEQQLSLAKICRGVVFQRGSVCSRLACGHLSVFTVAEHKARPARNAMRFRI